MFGLKTISQISRRHKKFEGITKKDFRESIVNKSICTCSDIERKRERERSGGREWKSEGREGKGKAKQRK